MNSAQHACQEAFRAIQEILLSDDRRIKSPIEYLGTILNTHLFRSSKQETVDLANFIQEALQSKRIDWKIICLHGRYLDVILCQGEWKFAVLTLSNNTTFGNTILISIDPELPSKV